MGAYEIVRVLGAGGFGITYHARNTVLRRRSSVALKEFFPNGFAARDGNSPVIYSTQQQDTIA